MNKSKIEIQQKIQNVISLFNSDNLFDNSISLFNTLGYNTARQNRLDGNSFNDFKNNFIDADDNFNEGKAFTNEWKKVELLFQLTNEEVTGLTDMFSSGKVDNAIIESYLFFAVELSGQNYSRTKLSSITREINKLFSMPVMVLFFYDEKLTLAIINRRLHKRDASKDVLEKVTLIKDIRIENPHRAHIEILYDLSFDVLVNNYNVTNFVELHRAWEKVLDTNELNKKFFRELSNWYFWAVNEVEFPDDAEKDRDKRNPISVIRLITRLMFVWFIKEKGLINQQLFDKSFLDTILKYDDITDSTYYKAILQNLFFATLNTEMNIDKPGSRKFVKDQYLVHNLYRYADLFNDKTKALKLFENIPFLNGGLFECLDRKDDNGNVIRIDCFSENPKNRKRLKVPDYLFFGDEQIVDLSEVYGNKKKNKEKVKPIIDILNSYKFTIAENTPIEEEVALDPELLGKVFENLLASYNPETKTTARKQTGSFYTPREIVNYMVDESLIAYFITKLSSSEDNLPEDDKKEIETKLRRLFEYNEQPHKFNDDEVDILINAIDEIKILDPAAGSGAFPMGILHRLVFLLHKLDPHNKKWKQKQIDKINEIEDPTVREQLLTDVEESFENNELDYGRKLYLIENCIYGVDIQPIAVQIAKLRFFISLVVDQKVNLEKKNFGIRPLPNLETKFVAANTLIGLEKEEDNLFTNPEIDTIKEQLKNVRHRYFTARTHRTKEKYRGKDKELRQKLSELLTKEHYLQPKDAIMLANWDPYDQNASSPFFDPEWMFGIKEGFDIILGNPPYFNISPKNILRTVPYYNKLSNGIVNSASLFSYYAFENTNNIVAFIIPKSFTFVESWSPIRNFILQYSSVICAFDVGIAFDNVGLEMIVIVFSKEYKSSITKILDYKGNISSFVQKEFLNRSCILTSINQEKYSLIREIEKNSINLNSISLMPRGLTLHSSTFINNQSKGSIQILGGTNVERFKLKDGNKRKPNRYILMSNTIYINKQHIFNKNRIVYQNIASSIPKIVATIERLGLPTDDTLNNLILIDENYQYEYILSILNSSIATFYLKNAIINNAILTVHLDKPYVGKLPIHKKSFKTQVIFRNLVEIIEQSLHPNYFFTILDSIVFELYFPSHMKEREIDIIKYVEQDINEVMQGREFEQLTDSEKEEVIKKLHKKWTDPDSIVRNRIKLMPIKSPDIIKPILESK